MIDQLESIDKVFKGDRLLYFDKSDCKFYRCCVTSDAGHDGLNVFLSDEFKKCTVSVFSLFKMPTRFAAHHDMSFALGYPSTIPEEKVRVCIVNLIFAISVGTVHCQVEKNHAKEACSRNDDRSVGKGAWRRIDTLHWSTRQSHGCWKWLNHTGSFLCLLLSYVVVVYMCHTSYAPFPGYLRFIRMWSRCYLVKINE